MNLFNQVLLRASKTHAATLKCKEYLRICRLSQLAVNKISVTKEDCLSTGTNYVEKQM